MLAEQRAEIGGHVRLSCSAGFGRDHLLPVLSGLQMRYPSLTIEVDFDDRVIDLVKDGYDLAIRGGQIADSGLVSRPICRLGMVLVAAPDYLLATFANDDALHVPLHTLNDYVYTP